MKYLADIIILKKKFTGEGEFGDVYQGIYITEAGEYKEVAVKALSKDNIQPNQVRKIVQLNVIWILIAFCTHLISISKE